MELRQLRYAVAVATYRHFTRAAASVPVAQPALSHQVRLLEQELGIELFERSRGGVRLTEAGEIFVLRARRALSEMDAAREEIAALKGLASGRLVLGAMQALGGLDLPRLLSAFQATHPGIDVSLREDSTRDMFTLAARGELDLAIAALDVDRPLGLESAVLVREPVLVAVPAGHRLASAGAVDFRHLREETFIFFKEGTGLRTVSERAAERAGFVPRVGFQTSSHGRLLALVGQGLGVALVPASAVSDPRPPGVVALPALPGIDRTVGAVWRAGQRHTPAASAFLGLLREHASQMRVLTGGPALPATGRGRLAREAAGDPADVLVLRAGHDRAVVTSGYDGVLHGPGEAAGTLDVRRGGVGVDGRVLGAPYHERRAMGGALPAVCWLIRSSQAWGHRGLQVSGWVSHVVVNHDVPELLRAHLTVTGRADGNGPRSTFASMDAEVTLAGYVTFT